MERNEKPETDNLGERAILVGASFTSREGGSTDETLAELAGLLETAGGRPLFTVMQNRESPDTATFLGKGKIIEIEEMVRVHEAQLIIFDSDLTPTQIRNVEKITGARVLDRSMLILDIFAMRAKTKEGKLQVELAQNQYLMPRLTTSYDALSRLGGGIGTRGPGETKLESDRRHLKERIRIIKEELREGAKTRELQRKRRQKGTEKQVSLIGYTNAGKSTLFNLLTGEGVLAEDKLFATLDPLSRNMELKNGTKIILTDTVGFIRKLPHHLISAFRSTLEEVRFADLLLHVIDCSNPSWPQQERVVLDLLEELRASNIPLITLYNKSDIADISMIPKGEDAIFISAMTKAGVEEAMRAVEERLRRMKRSIKILLPYKDGGILKMVHERGEILKEEYKEGGIEIELFGDEALTARLNEFQTEDEA